MDTHKYVGGCGVGFFFFDWLVGLEVLFWSLLMFELLPNHSQLKNNEMLC